MPRRACAAVPFLPANCKAPEISARAQTKMCIQPSKEVSLVFMGGEDSGRPVMWDWVSGECPDLRVEGQKIAIERNLMPSMRDYRIDRPSKWRGPGNLFGNVNVDDADRWGLFSVREFPIT